MCRILLFFRMLLLLALESHAHQNPGCAATVPELRVLLGDPAFSLQWEEITMDDGKPLRVSIQEKDGHCGWISPRLARGCGQRAPA